MSEIHACLWFIRGEKIRYQWENMEPDDMGGIIIKKTPSTSSIKRKEEKRYNRYLSLVDGTFPDSKGLSYEYFHKSFNRESKILSYAKKVMTNESKRL